MALNLSALEQAFARIEDVTTATLDFEVGGVPVRIRTLLPDEETEIQLYAQSAYEELEGEDEDNALSANLQYLNRIKIGTLSYGIVKIGDLDFQDSDVVETGEILENGNPVVIPKHEAVREVLLKLWGLPTTLAVFKKFAEFVGKREERSEKLVEYEPSDLDTEIQRLKDRIEELEAKKKEAEEKISSPTAEQVREAEKQIEQASEEPLDESSDFEPPNTSPYNEEPEDAEIVVGPEQMVSHMPPEKRPVAQERQPAIPAQVPPPPPRKQQPQPKDESQTQPETLQEEETPPADPLAYLGNSFVDFTDSDNVQQQMAAEERRLLEGRLKAQRDAAQQAAQGQPVTPPGDIIVEERIPASRIPPHVAAQRAAQEQDFDAGEVAELEKTTDPAAEVGGVKAYRITEADTLTKKKPIPSEQPVANPRQTKGSLNPRFRGKKK